jgi:GRIP domain
MAETTSTTAEMPSSDKATMARLTAQLKKLTEANGKYKTLLKMAKERIQQQEDELIGLRQDKVVLEGRLQTAEENKESLANQIALDDNIGDRGSGGADGGGEGGTGDVQIVRVCQRIRLPVAAGVDEIWALMEQEVVNNDMMITDNGAAQSQSQTQSHSVNKRFKEWKRFDTESQLQDYIRRDTGEPIQLPPFSLSPEQSAMVSKETAQQVAAVTEEFRRFRVRSELARKQADAQIRALQSSHVQSAARQIEGNDHQQELEQARPTTVAGGGGGGGHQLEQQMRAELAAQEAHWKEAYETLLAENNALKSTGSEALLASQWRQRYEHCLQEKEALKSRLMSESFNGGNRNGDNNDAGKYEAKYRDLKESFRLYRKKAKEMFEAQQQTGGESGMMLQHHLAAAIDGSADSKISYLRNLMVNYLTSDQAVRDHMEGAIGTVLQFTPEEIARIEKKRQENEAWF